MLHYNIHDPSVTQPDGNFCWKLRGQVEELEEEAEQQETEEEEQLQWEDIAQCPKFAFHIPWSLSRCTFSKRIKT